jgi:pyruvate/2-oxoglutarate dehydrogenase complex dihydrolipoamide dehydrogenase (E3) component
LVAAIGAGILGARVALVERDLLGGDCLNTGCVPSKTLIRAARVVREVRAAASFGVRTGELEVDFPQVMERVRRVRSEIAAHDAAAKVRGFGVDVFLGEARFESPVALRVDGQRLRFHRAVIATGARAKAPDIPGLAEAGYRTNETVFNLTDRPANLVVVGGGPVGCELAQAFALLGSHVTLIQHGPQLLPREDAEVAAVVQDALCRDGVDVLVSADVKSVHVEGGRRVVVVTQGQRQMQLAADEILVGTGRAPNVDLNLEAAGVAFDETHGVHVNDRLQTTSRRIYAAGDVCMKDKFTHAADAAARLVLQNALFFGWQRVSRLVIPSCTYTSPEVARVGINEQQARARGLAIHTFKMPMADVDRAIADGETDGFTQIHLHQGRVVGGTVVAAHAGDMLAPLTMACTLGLGLSDLTRVIVPYPTQAEALSRALDMAQLARLTPPIQRMLRLWFSLIGRL